MNEEYRKEITRLRNSHKEVKNLAYEEVSLVGCFDEQGRGSRRDIDLPLHTHREQS